MLTIPDATIATPPCFKKIPTEFRGDFLAMSVSLVPNLLWSLKEFLEIYVKTNLRHVGRAISCK
ncbi:hypothetical protein EBT25_08985 [bacterium]|nr:hypothetical protein [bacterium]